MHGLEGTRLGRYLLRQRLGRGGMSEVYLAADELMHRDVAVKVVSSAHTDYVERFQREAIAIGTLQHDHILPAYDYGEQLPWYYLVMPYIDYCTLLDKLQQGPLSPEYAGELLTQIASGLQYAHDHGVIHRDIKPSNILMRDDHYVYLADFGLARSIEGADKVTQTGVLLGTPEYMAPELADGPPNKSSDIYALGILLYQMVTGKMPFSGDNPLAVYLKQLREPPVPPSRIRPDIPRSVELVILRALEKDPRRRYDSPMALARAYTQALDHQQPDQASLSPGASLLYATTPMGNDLVHQEANPTPHLPLMEDEPLPAPTAPISPVAPVAPVPSSRPPPQPVQPPKQQERLVLPAYTPPQTPRGKPPYVAGPVTPNRRVPARSSRGRSPGITLAFVIALIFLAIVFIIVGIGVSAYNNQRHSPPPSSLSLTQSTAGDDVTPSPAQSSPTTGPTAQPTSNQQAIYNQATAVTGGAPLLSDPLSSNSGNRWPDDGVTCSFRNGAYHVLVNRKSYLQPCSPNGYTFDNCAIKVDVTLLQGNDAGFIFRQNGDQFYDFEINDQGQYYFRRHDANAGANYVTLVSSTFSSAIHGGASPNTLMVIANGSDFRLFINGVFVSEVHDSTYSSGVLSLVAGTLATASNADASFANLNVYPIPG